MSRCILDNEKTGTEVAIGWDPGLCTFFAQVMEPGEDDPSIWLGLRHQQFIVPDELVDAIVPSAMPFDRRMLINNLLLDQQSNSERVYSI